VSQPTPNTRPEAAPLETLATVPEIRHLVHALREPLAAFIIQVELLEGEQLTAAGQESVKTMRGLMERAGAALEEITFVLVPIASGDRRIEETGSFRAVSAARSVTHWCYVPVF
jgi:hypothetical protein